LITPIARQLQLLDLAAKQPLTLKSFSHTTKVQSIRTSKSKE